ncbi:hypothetical protein STVA_43770 [Allostella vacuolata]|nr:hypothetical protein STVA_43770 [Stella vacuolata]
MTDPVSMMAQKTSSWRRVIIGGTDHVSGGPAIGIAGEDRGIKAAVDRIAGHRSKRPSTKARDEEIFLSPQAFAPMEKFPHPEPRRGTL